MEELLAIYLFLGLTAGWCVYMMEDDMDDMDEELDVDGVPLPVFLVVCALAAPFAVALAGIKLFERYV